MPRFGKCSLRVFCPRGSKARREAGNGKEAVEATKQLDPDVVKLALRRAHNLLCCSRALSPDCLSIPGPAVEEVPQRARQLHRIVGFLKNERFTQ